jgi:hypothetical protein
MEKVSAYQMWQAEYRAICLMDSLFRVAQTSFSKRNVEVTEYSLVATRDIPVGTFIGFYTGEFSQDERSSMYAAKLNHMHIYPFANEETITIGERESRPLANMNEPSKGTYANCCMIVQDFKHDEIIFANDLQGQEVSRARFFRGLACFTCARVKGGEELTWYYGKSYESNRASQGYEAGRPCNMLIENTAFIPDDSQGVLSVMPRVEYSCVIPIFGMNKSSRFALPKKKKRRKNDSDDESTTSSSSGSGHIPKYDPTKSTTTRSDRVRARVSRE